MEDGPEDASRSTGQGVSQDAEPDAEHRAEPDAEQGGGQGAGQGGALSRRRAIALGAGGTALLLAGGAGLLSARSGHTKAPFPEATRPAGAFDPAMAGVILANRARALEEGDRTAFLATVGSAPAAFQDAQSRLYDNLRKIPLEGWRERVVSTQITDGSTGDTVVRVEVRYRLRGFDRGDVARTRYLMLAPRDGTWVIVGDGSSHGHADDAEIWDGGPLSVVRSRSSLVIGDAAGLDGIAARLDAAVPVVTGVIGKGWPQRAVALVPAEPRLATALAGQNEDLGDIAALATTVPSASGGRGEDRVIVSPVAFARLNELGRDVVLTHELTHVATGGARDGTTPLWLIEGFADYVGYRRAKIGVRPAAGELRSEVAAGRLPAALPTAADFTGGSQRLSQAYQEAWLACRMVADRYGEATLVRLYRTAGRVPEAVALRDVLGLTRDRFTGLWRDYLKRELQ
ncbi:basic secretory family protein [Actinomadura fibrosa]|uniref:Basic secretory family protein n=1 Tax=Actinomadura fibrosa TaxID=111802 RepID=A0ABW2XK19_9ACTN|nr:basic secretory family protein [Actinomadura fibrosa]